MSHPDPTREYGEHPEEPQHREYMRTQGYRQGHVKKARRTDGMVSSVDATKAFNKMAKKLALKRKSK